MRTYDRVCDVALHCPVIDSNDKHVGSVVDGCDGGLSVRCPITLTVYHILVKEIEKIEPHRVVLKISAMQVREGNDILSIWPPGWCPEVLC